MQRGGAQCGVGLPVEVQVVRPVGVAEVHVGEPEPRYIRVRCTPQLDQERVGVHGNDGRAGDAVEDAGPEGAGAASEVKYQRVGSLADLLDHVDQRGELFLALR